MKALILVGGYGTRLRPLTLTQPKPLVEFANKPMMMHQIEALAAVGVDTVVLAVSYRAEMVEKELEQQATRLGIKVHFSHEEQPLGTAGPIALAKEYLKGDDPFFVLNSDVICDFPFKSMVDFHKRHGREGTIAVTRVEEPSKYGVVLFDENSGRIDRFVEKPQEYVGNKINAGIYVFSASVIDRIEPKPISIEKEIFPVMAEQSDLFAFVLPGFWMDVGQPIDFLTGTGLYLRHIRETNNGTLARGANIVGNVLIADSAQIGEDCKLGPNVVIGAKVRIETGVRLKNCTIHPGSVIGQQSYVDSSIVGRKCSIGRWVHVENTSVIGDEVTVKDELYLSGARIVPLTVISASVPEPENIM